MKTFIIAAFFSVSLAAQAQEATPGATEADTPFPPAQNSESLGFSSALLNRLTSSVQQWVDSGKVAGSEVLIIRNNQKVHHRAFGYSDLEKAKPLEKNVPYDLRSMTKTFTGAAILLLVQEGKLNFQDKAATYLSAFNHPKASSITIGELLSMTSGIDVLSKKIDRLTKPLDQYTKLQEVVDEMGRIGIDAVPGEFIYSDVNSYVLAEIVSQVSGMPAGEFITTRILEPLGLHDTYTYFRPDAPWATGVPAFYYWNKQEEKLEKVWDNSQPSFPEFFRGSGGMYGTAVDFAKWATVWMNMGKADGHAFFKPALVEQALTAYSDGAHRGGYGYHWTVSKQRTDHGLPKVFGHGGYAGTRIWVFPEIQTMVLYFSQSSGTSSRADFLKELRKFPIFEPYLSLLP